MYTVIRIVSISAAPEEHERIGGQLDVLIPGAFQGLRRAGDGFASEVATTGNWGDHRTAILNFLRAGCAAIAQARQVGIEVCVDVAVEPEDCAGTPVFCVHADSELIRMLAQADVSLEFSFYGADSRSDGLRE